jgi:hypothetical protein
MATQTPPAQTTAPFAPGSIIWQRKGPLPVWAWALLLLGAVLAWSMWRKNRSAADATAIATGDGTPLPGDQTPPPVFVVPQAATPAVNVTVPITTVPTAPPAAGAPPPTGGGTPTPPGGFVTVSKYPDNTKPKESTLWDIAATWLPQGANSWALIWNHPLNSDLRKKRGNNYRHIQAGDKLFVPGKLGAPR